MDVKASDFFYPAIAIAFGMALGVMFGKSCCPEIRVGQETTQIVVKLHDTLRDTVEQVKIRYLERPIEAGPHRCYSWDKHYDDGGYVKCEACSDSLRTPVPGDFQGHIERQEPPDTNVVISRVDTAIVEKAKPLHKDWRFYIVGAVMAAIGALINGQAK